MGNLIIIVNDGSTDKTVNVVKKYLDRYPWIKLVNFYSENKKREVGAKVVRAFNEGYKCISNHDYNFIVKLDGDLTLPENARIIEKAGEVLGL